MQASDIMSSPVVTVTLDTTVKEFARVMVDHRISAVPVMHQEGMIVIVTGDQAAT